MSNRVEDVEGGTIVVCTFNPRSVADVAGSPICAQAQRVTTAIKNARVTRLAIIS
jgi:hypothetical protein